MAPRLNTMDYVNQDFQSVSSYQQQTNLYTVFMVDMVQDWKNVMSGQVVEKVHSYPWLAKFT